MEEEDAVKYLIAGLRNGKAYSNYGYDLYLPNVMREYATAELGPAAHGSWLRLLPRGILNR